MDDFPDVDVESKLSFSAMASASVAEVYSAIIKVFFKVFTVLHDMVVSNNLSVYVLLAAARVCSVVSTASTYRISSQALLLC